MSSFKATSESAPEYLAGRFRVQGRLGEGTMAVVYKAWDESAANWVAVKCIKKTLAEDSQFMQSVHDNFDLTKPIRHPHICSSLELIKVEATGEVLIVMEFVEGLTLTQWIRNWQSRHLGETMPMDTVLAIAEQLAYALDYAHSLPVRSRSVGTVSKYGIIHRDLKPDNILVVADKVYRQNWPSIKIVDLGLAIEIQANILSKSIGGMKNAMAGSPAYMAPEQFRGNTLTRGVDQWALAVIIYEMVSNRRPFEGKNWQETAGKIVLCRPQKPATLTEPQWLALHRTFQVDRRKRYESCMGLLRVLADSDTGTINTIQGVAPSMPGEFDGIDENEIDPTQRAALIKRILIAAIALPLAIVAAWLLFGFVTRLNESNKLKDELDKIASRATDAAGRIDALKALKDLAIEIPNAKENDGYRVLEGQISARVIQRKKVQEALESTLNASINKDNKLALKLLGETEALIGKDAELISEFEGPVNSLQFALIQVSNTNKSNNPRDLISEIETTLTGKKLNAAGIYELGSTDKMLIEGNLAKLFEQDSTNPVAISYLRKLDYPKTEQFSVGPKFKMDFVLVRGGEEFTMGIEGDSDINEAPAHKVVIQKPFYISVNPVTVEQFAHFTEVHSNQPNGTGYKPEKNAVGWDFRSGQLVKAPIDWKSTPDKANMPATMVSWDDANEFCQYLGRNYHVFRLPTEAEWEYAARGSANSIYPWGNEWDGTIVNHADKSAAGLGIPVNFLDDDKFETLAPVGHFPKNKSWCGALDMAGNVWQWCSDRYKDDYGKTQNPSLSPTGPRDGILRVMKGGSWASLPPMCRSYARIGAMPTLRKTTVGFRVVAEVIKNY